MNHTTRPMRRASRARMIPIVIGSGLVLSMLTSSRAVAQTPPLASSSAQADPASTTPLAQAIPPGSEARVSATNDLLRRAQTAIDAKDFREAVELYRRAKVNAQPIPAMQPGVQALRQKLTVLGFDSALLDLPPSAPPAAAAAAMGTQAASPQPLPIPMEAKALPSADLATRKADAMRLLASGRAALDRGDIASAQRFVRDAEALSIPEGEFKAGEPRVWQLALDVDSAARRAGVTSSVGQWPPTNTQPGSLPTQPGTIQQVGGVMPAGGAAATGGVVNSVYNSVGDTTSVQPAQATAPIATGQGETLYREGLDALASGNSGRARELFVEAWKHEATMDLTTRNQLKEKLTLMQPGRLPAVTPNQDPATLTPIQKADMEAQAETRRVYREVTAELAAANEMKESSPMEALDRLTKLRGKITESKVDVASQNSMMTMVDRAIADQRSYVEANRGQIDMDLANAAVEAEMATEAANKKKVDDEIASLVETFNDLMEQRRYPEAEVVAKKVSELAPGSSIAKSMFHTSRMGTRLMINEDIASAKEDNVNKTFLEVDRAGIPMDPANDYQMPDAKYWGELTRRRAEANDADTRLSSVEQDIKRRMSTPVDMNYKNRPLAEVLQDLSAVTNIPIILDSRALAELRVNSDSPVTLELTKPISLSSALNIILSEYELTYVIQNDVLNITSVEAKKSMVYPRTYRVTDLVTPIPNFAASYEDGLAGALRAAHQMTTRQSDVQIMPVSMTDLAQKGPSGATGQAMNPNVMAQYAAMGSQGGFGLQNPPGGGGRGGAALADFGSLMDLIQTTVSPETWEALGGPSSMRPYPQNLSLVVRTTSEVHDEITQLLESLRRLQNLQVTIEVRFITLSDSFFEQIGVDFDVQFDDNVNDIPDEDDGPSVTIGFDGINGVPTTDFDVQLSNNFGVQPAFGAFDAGSGSRIGFAILSDIEAFFFLQAAQGDTRNNVLQAPKVTLFDGQLATISDVTQRPFVTSITPVVGDFAVAQQPVIVVLNEGTQLNVQAIVSDDKRFVRLTLVPFFSQIGNVDTFTYEGRRRRTTTSEEIDPTTGEPINTDEETDVIEGTTVQLPQFAFTSVSTTVSVPDGGTILLGGIKRLSEGRSERGVPILSKIPYISRLFRNVAIGRDARSLMLMVTPRIIIQEEEEIAQTGFDATR